MTAGFRTFDASENQVITITTRFTRFFGRITSSTSGSMNVPEFAYGTPMIIGVPSSSGQNIFSVIGVGSVSGTTLSWTAGCDFYYGVY